MPRAPSARRQQLAEGAIDLLAEHGAHGLTHRRLDRWLELPEGSTSNLFPTREALLAAALDALVEVDLGGLDALAAEVRRRLPDGALHALVNNAGISPKGEGGARLGVRASDAALWAQVLNVNLVSTALLARALFPDLRRVRGSVVNVTSIAGSRVHPFAGVAYAASKAALVALTRELAH